ncbi:acyltransferase [Algoriphagus litoralis]|uniref:acyltransferase n=1 Tax=Algoriphagus litoralis TaxID=2202829 RepID=UPI000DBA255B|nr:acyltransferase [Algoriphagus litoralis]
MIVLLKKLYILFKLSGTFLFDTLFRILEISSQVFPSSAWGCNIRGWVYKPFLRKCGNNFQVALGAKLEHCRNIEVGNDVYIGHGCWISGVRGGIIFGDEVMLGPGVKMVSSNHTPVNGSYRFGPGIGKEIKIGKGTWIAANAVITAGVYIGDGCLVAAGAVVTKSFDSNSVIAGIPAKNLSK